MYLPDASMPESSQKVVDWAWNGNGEHRFGSEPRPRPISPHASIFSEVHEAANPLVFETVLAYQRFRSAVVDATEVVREVDQENVAVRAVPPLMLSGKLALQAN